MKTLFIFSIAAIILIIAAIDVSPQTEKKEEGAVIISTESLSGHSNQTDPPVGDRLIMDYLVAYDSSSVNGRTSRDSVVNNLTALGLTFDLFNKGSQTSTNAISLRGYKAVFWLGEATSVMSLVQKDSVKAYLNAGTPAEKSKLIICAEDIGYQFGRAVSTYYDLDFVNNYLGFNYIADRPSSVVQQGLVGVAINAGLTDSTVGSWPDVLSSFDPPNSQVLYRFRSFPDSANAIGYKKPNFEVATFGTDVRALRPAIDSPPGSPVKRILTGALSFVPVELTAFTANASGSNVNLQWSTATETNNQGFEIERNTNGRYEKIGYIPGAGTTTSNKDYFFIDYNVSDGKYIYRLKQIDFDGTFSYSPEVEIEVITPDVFSLSQNYPNPFNPSTRINFSLKVDSKVTLTIFNILGQEIATLLNGNLPASGHQITFDASSLNSGIYLYRIDAQGIDGSSFSETKKMTLIK